MVVHKTRDWLIDFDVMLELLGRVLDQVGAEGLLLKEHLSVDLAVNRTWTSRKSLVPTKRPKPPRDG